MATVNKTAYRKAMGLHGGNKVYQRSRALNRAHEIRKFEIELLWKRALYIWGFQLAVIVAVASVFEAKSESQNREFLYPFLLSIGLIAAVAQVLVYKGAKFWQETWEFHIDMLEEEFEGKIHQLHLKEEKNNNDEPVNDEPVNEGPISVSKVGEFTSVIFLWCWIAVWLVSLAALFTPSSMGDLVKACACGNLLQVAWGIILLGFTGLSVWVLCQKTKGSSEKPKTITSKQRTITYK